MKTLVALLILALPLIAQTRVDLESKYGQSNNDRYQIESGTFLEAKFSATGQIKSFRIFADDSKNPNAVANVETARKAIRELVGRRMCRGPLESLKSEIACPRRKKCSETKERWRGLATSMVWDEKSFVSVAVTMLDEPPTPPPGSIKLLEGYVHEPGCGIDTKAGSIVKRGGMEIRYDIGSLAGNFAIRYANSDLAEWTKNEFSDGESVQIVLTKGKRIYATFRKDTANFFANVSSQSDIDDFLKMILTY